MFLIIETGIKVNIDLRRSSNDFVLMSDKNSESVEDTEKYKLVMLNCALFVPVGILSTPMYQVLYVITHFTLEFKRYRKSFCVSF